VDAVVSSGLRETLAWDDEQAAGPPAVARLHCSEIAIVLA
jgi:hypothetical protein